VEINFDRLWKIENRSKKKQKEFWDLRAQEFNSRIDSERNIKDIERVIRYLRDKGALQDESSVLDIGCGPGKYALAFAKEVKKVTGTDISDKMIAFAQENAKKRDLKNVEFVLASWPEVELPDMGWEKSFELVFAAFCPGIDSGDALRKMIEASRKHCFLSGFVTRKDQVLDALKEYLGIQSKSWGNQIYFSFNLLWQWGYYPEIVYQDRSWTNEYDIEEMADILSIRLNNQASREDIIEYLKTISISGRIREQSTSKVAWLYWQV